VSTGPLFFVDALPDGEPVLLDGPQGRHAAMVRRVRVGERMQLGDGHGGLAGAVVRSVGRDRVELEVTERIDVPAPELRVVLAQALVKGDRGELAVELATEAGVDEVLPWRASRCVARWEDGPRGDKALGRWRATVREAAKQARRAWVPVVGEPVTTGALVQRVAVAAGALVLHEGAVVGLAELAAPAAAADRAVPVEHGGPAGGLPAHGDLLIVVGPEGGITDDEVAALVAAGARSVRLGPEVLRASTAAAVALAALGAMTDRWRS